MPQSNRFERLLSTALLLATLAIVGLLVEQRLNRRETAMLGSPTRVERVPEWQAVRDSVAALVDSGEYRVPLLVFTDFECIFCARLDSVVARVNTAAPFTLARSIVHFPLPTHRNAREAAAAFECAREQGRARAIYEGLFAKQRDIGNRSWWAFGADAGVPDSSLFAECLEASRTEQRIQRGIAIGEKWRISGTPAVVIDGWLLDPTTPALFEEALSKVLAGQSPSR